MDEKEVVGTELDENVEPTEEEIKEAEQEVNGEVNIEGTWWTLFGMPWSVRLS